MLALFVPVEACRKNCIAAVILICEPDSVIQHRLLRSLWIRAKRDVRGELDQHVNCFCFALLLDPSYVLRGPPRGPASRTRGAEHRGLGGPVPSCRGVSRAVLLCGNLPWSAPLVVSNLSCPCHFEPLIFQGYGAFGKRVNLLTLFSPCAARRAKRAGFSRACGAFRV